MCGNVSAGCLRSTEETSHARLWERREFGCRAGWRGGGVVSDLLEGSPRGRINSHQPEVDHKGKKHPNPFNSLLKRLQVSGK